MVWRWPVVLAVVLLLILAVLALTGHLHLALSLG